jgi:hypothetical protein
MIVKVNFVFSMIKADIFVIAAGLMIWDRLLLYNNVEQIESF